MTTSHELPTLPDNSYFGFTLLDVDDELGFDSEVPSLGEIVSADIGLIVVRFGKELSTVEVKQAHVLEKELGQLSAKFSEEKAYLSTFNEVLSLVNNDEIDRSIKVVALKQVLHSSEVSSSKMPDLIPALITLKMESIGATSLLNNVKFKLLDEAIIIFSSKNPDIELTKDTKFKLRQYASNSLGLRIFNTKGYHSSRGCLHQTKIQEFQKIVDALSSPYHVTQKLAEVCSVNCNEYVELNLLINKLLSAMQIPKDKVSLESQTKVQRLVLTQHFQMQFALHFLKLTKTDLAHESEQPEVVISIRTDPSNPSTPLHSHKGCIFSFGAFTENQIPLHAYHLEKVDIRDNLKFAICSQLIDSCRSLEDMVCVWEKYIQLQGLPNEQMGVAEYRYCEKLKQLIHEGLITTKANYTWSTNLPLLDKMTIEEIGHYLKQDCALSKLEYADSLDNFCDCAKESLFDMNVESVFKQERMNEFKQQFEILYKEGCIQLSDVLSSQKLLANSPMKNFIQELYLLQVKRELTQSSNVYKLLYFIEVFNQQNCFDMDSDFIREIKKVLIEDLSSHISQKQVSLGQFKQIQTKLKKLDKTQQQAFDRCEEKLLKNLVDDCSNVTDFERVINAINLNSLSKSATERVIQSLRGKIESLLGNCSSFKSELTTWISSATAEQVIRCESALDLVYLRCSCIQRLAALDALSEKSKAFESLEVLAELSTDLLKTHCDNRRLTNSLIKVLKTKKPSVELCSKLIEAGADLAIKDWEGNCLLMLAINSKSLEIIDLVLAQKTTYCSENKKGETPCHWAIGLEDESMRMKVFLASKELVNQITHTGYAPIHLAVLRGNIALVEQLLSLGVETETQTNIVKAGSGSQHSDGLLHLAVRHDKQEMLEWLLQTDFGKEQLHIANEQGATPVLLAAMQGTISAVSILIKAGAKVGRNDRELEGRNALHLSAMNERLDVFNFFWDQPQFYKKDKDKKNKDLVKIAISCERPETLKVMLASSHFDPLEYDKNGQNYLHYAAGSRSPKCVAVLGKKVQELGGLQRRITNLTSGDSNKTALEIALTYRRSENVEILKELLMDSRRVQRLVKTQTPSHSVKTENSPKIQDYYAIQNSLLGYFPITGNPCADHLLNDQIWQSTQARIHHGR
ncbi:hypothetical protein D5R81_06380 [Parashewanella spongiae]|uniref:Uncharacterized protein n=3 Tax=Parashewanella spongiae TaxID=342950 RepID=A0A3A6TYL9_9GAMM|nr:ankyrin repeat domain-containing protein [Parashewanella spongiae]RJY18195.1 hypothetical protein D5R81_06380 [Parashewanella spongiae]